MRGQKMELDKSEFTLSEAMARTCRILNKEVLDSDLHYNKGIKLVVGGGEVERNAENDKSSLERLKIVSHKEQNLSLTLKDCRILMD